MLSCFRSIVRQKSFFVRPALNSFPTVSFSTRDVQDQDAYKPLFSLLQDEGDKQEKKGSDFALSLESQEDTLYAQKKELLRPFHRNKPLHPSQFSRERRIVSRRRPRKPWDLGPAMKVARQKDMFHRLEIDPVDECMNTSLLSGYVTALGRIKKRADTMLTQRTQRRLSKAIKRAKMMGILPIHRHAQKGLTRFSRA